MGQGTVTSLSQLLAEELECDWGKFRTEFPPVDPAFGFQTPRTVDVTGATVTLDKKVIELSSGQDKPGVPRPVIEIGKDGYRRGSVFRPYRDILPDAGFFVLLWLNHIGTLSCSSSSSSRRRLRCSYGAR